MRYIDADALIKKIFPYDVVDKKDYTINAKAVADAIANTPTADVVPKREVKLDFTEEEIMRSLREAGIEVSDKSISEIKAEVARKIFEEINTIKKEYASGDIDGNELYVRLYMLEKKYTENME